MYADVSPSYDIWHIMHNYYVRKSQTHPERYFTIIPRTTDTDNSDIPIARPRDNSMGLEYSVPGRIKKFNKNLLKRDYILSSECVRIAFRSTQPVLIDVPRIFTIPSDMFSQHRKARSWYSSQQTPSWFTVLLLSFSWRSLLGCWWVASCSPMNKGHKFWSLPSSNILFSYRLALSSLLKNYSVTA